MANPVVLYGANTGNCIRASIALEEAGVPYLVRVLDLGRGEHRTKEYLELNPAGKVPTLVDENADGGPFVLTQSNAISVYAAGKSPGTLLPADDAIANAVVLERHFYFVTDVITQSFAAFALQKRGFTEASSVLNAGVLSAVIAGERFVSESAFMAGDRFSLADISAFTITLFLEKQIDWAAHPHLLRWFDLIGRRPGVLRGLKAFRDA